LDTLLSDSGDIDSVISGLIQPSALSLGRDGIRTS
jgi:hypothetical protein